jgi:hypothetical protein
MTDAATTQLPLGYLSCHAIPVRWRVLFAYCVGGADCIWSAETIARQIESTAQEVRDARQRLCRDGLLVRQTVSKRDSNGVGSAYSVTVPQPSGSGDLGERSHHSAHRQPLELKQQPDVPTAPAEVPVIGVGPVRHRPPSKLKRSKAIQPKAAKPSKPKLEPGLVSEQEGAERDARIAYFSQRGKIERIEQDLTLPRRIDFAPVELKWRYKPKAEIEAGLFVEKLPARDPELRARIEATWAEHEKVKQAHTVRCSEIREAHEANVAKLFDELGPPPKGYRASC